MTDVFSKEKRSEIMSRVRNKDTDIELVLRRRLWAAGCRYRVHYKVIGSPDIAFVKRKVAVFCDGDFWHGRRYFQDRGKYKRFWKEKILKNINRDKEVTRTLKRTGWAVLRFWKSDILMNPDQCVRKVVSIMSK